jgi:hypothetical protein
MLPSEFVAPPLYPESEGQAQRRMRIWMFLAAVAVTCLVSSDQFFLETESDLPHPLRHIPTGEHYSARRLALFAACLHVAPHRNRHMDCNSIGNVGSTGYATLMIGDYDMRQQRPTLSRPDPSGVRPSLHLHTGERLRNNLRAAYSASPEWSRGWLRPRDRSGFQQKSAAHAKALRDRGLGPARGAALGVSIGGLLWLVIGSALYSIWA